MLPESPETFKRNWENNRSAGLPAAKSPLRGDLGTIKKEPIMIHHVKGRSKHEKKPKRCATWAQMNLLKKLMRGRKFIKMGTMEAEIRGSIK